MITHTERTNEIFVTVVLFALTALFYFLAYMLFLDHKPAFGYSMTIFALAGTLGAIFSIKTILVHRFAERAMRKMQKEKEGNR